jgi:hypothetical protein
MRALGRAAVVLAALAAPWRPAAAQVWGRLGADGALARVHLHASGSGIAETLSGVVAEGQGRVQLGSFVVQATYAQGRLAADSGAAAARDVVQASLAVAARPLPWLTVAAGPLLRAYAAAGTTERWVFWRARARAAGPVIFGTLRAHAEGWIALASSVNTDLGAGGARGGEAGLTMLVPNTALWARFAYVVDQARMKNGARIETLESVVLSIGLGVR